MICKMFKKFKRWLGENVVRPVRIKLYLVEWNLTR